MEWFTDSGGECGAAVSSICCWSDIRRMLNPIPSRRSRAAEKDYGCGMRGTWHAAQASSTLALDGEKHQVWDCSGLASCSQEHTPALLLQAPTLHHITTYLHRLVLILSKGHSRERWWRCAGPQFHERMREGNHQRSIDSHALCPRTSPCPVTPVQQVTTTH
jgi:hypothetical protein